MEALLEVLPLVLWLALTAAWIASLIETITNRKAGWAIFLVFCPLVALVYVFFLPRFVREARQRRESLGRGRRRLESRVKHLERELAQRPPASR
ncbi:MAG: hypothetical protein ABL998_11175 [Planctomycetota bacterium]